MTVHRMQVNIRPADMLDPAEKRELIIRTLGETYQGQQGPFRHIRLEGDEVVCQYMVSADVPVRSYALDDAVRTVLGQSMEHPLVLALVRAA